MLSLSDISVEYRQNKQSFWALKHINLNIIEGECLAVVGKSGCGKTTLINVMAGLKSPTCGSVKYCGVEMSRPVSEISMIFQNHGLFPWKTAKQNLLLPLILKKQKVDEETFIQLIKRLELEEQLNKYPCQLSGGQKQRVAIGRAILNEAKILLMDEPFSSLDQITKDNLQEHLQELFAEKNITSVLVTHSIEEAVSWGDKIAVFDHKGGTIQNILDNPGKGKSSTSSEQMKTLVKELLIGEGTNA